MKVTHIALLRAVNTAGHNAVKMAVLREFAVNLGFEHVRTFIQSGNLIFQSNRLAGAELEQRLEAESAKHLGFQTEFVVRTYDELKAIIKRNPLPEHAMQEASRVLVVFLKKPVKDLQLLQEAAKSSETVLGTGTELYIAYPKGIHESRLTLSFIEKKLGTRSTGRNWNTVLKLAALAHP
jgi:uncharacterized protein (DUF1697 family)